MGAAIFGTPGGSLGGSSNSWAANKDVASIGRAMEVRVGQHLNRLAESGQFAVLHDLTVPGSKGNVDHVVVGARDVLLIDAKSWRGGFYGTVRGKTFRTPGDDRMVSRFPHADKTWLPEAARRLGELVEASGSTARVRTTSLIVVGASKKNERVRLWATSVNGARILPLQVFERSGRRLLPRGTADNLALSTLIPLVR